MSKVVVRKAQSNIDRIVKPAPLVDSIYDIWENEIRRFAAKSKGPGLDLDDIRIVKEIGKSICDIRKDEREQLKADNIAGAMESLSKEELLEIVQAELKDSK